MIVIVKAIGRESSILTPRTFGLRVLVSYVGQRIVSHTIHKLSGQSTLSTQEFSDEFPYVGGIPKVSWLRGMFERTLDRVFYPCKGIVCLR